MTPGKPEAAAAIWSWQTTDAEARRQHIAKLRKGALIRFVISSLAGGAFFYFDRPITAYVVWCLGSLSLFFAIVSPLGIYTTLERAVSFLGWIVGRTLTWLLLAPVFYLFFAPFGLLFRRGARDPMKRGFERERGSYWKQRDEDRPNLDRPY
jgi:cytochrome c oxidase assembly factor CtaG